MSIVTGFLIEFWRVLAEAGIWLVLGFLAAGLIHIFLPAKLVEKHLSGRGLGSVIKGALIGAPIPLCSCSVIPTAAALHRRGVSKGTCAAFAVSSPEVDAPAISLTWGMLGPAMAIVRPIAAVLTAVTAGVLVNIFGGEGNTKPLGAERETVKPCCSTKPVQLPVKPCCSGSAEAEKASTPAVSASCCGGKAPPPFVEGQPGVWGRILEACRYGLVTLPGMLSVWLLVGLGLAALIGVIVEPGDLGGFGHSPWALLAALVVGVPLYVCSASSTPFAAAIVAAGISPGAALVFLLAGPATNPATMVWVWRDLGGRALAAYLVSIALVALGAGAVFDVMVRAGWFSVMTGGVHHEHVHGVDHFSAGLLALVLLGGLGRRLIPSGSGHSHAEHAPA